MGSLRDKLLASSRSFESDTPRAGVYNELAPADSDDDEVQIVNQTATHAAHSEPIVQSIREELQRLSQKSHGIPYVPK
jgi:hypothetical protein